MKGKSKGLRTVTKHFKSPVQQVRLISGKTQADFAASIGVTEEHLKHVEGGRPISDDLKAKIYDGYGAVVFEYGVPALAFGSAGMEPYTEASYLEHKQCFKPVWEPFRLDEVLEAFKRIARAVRSKAHKADDNGLVRLLRLELTEVARRTIEQFGVRDEIMEQVRVLRRSRDLHDVKVCYLICKITDAQALMRTLHQLPEIERLNRAGLFEAAKKGKIGEWFKDYIYPQE